MVPEALLLAVHGDLRAPLDGHLVVLLLVRVLPDAAIVGRPVRVSSRLGVNLLSLERVEVVGGELGALRVVVAYVEVGLGLVPFLHDLRAIVGADGVQLVRVVPQAFLFPIDLDLGPPLLRLLLFAHAAVLAAALLAALGDAQVLAQLREVVRGHLLDLRHLVDVVGGDVEVLRVRLAAPVRLVVRPGSLLLAAVVAQVHLSRPPADAALVLAGDVLVHVDALVLATSPRRLALELPHGYHASVDRRRIDHGQRAAARDLVVQAPVGGIGPGRFSICGRLLGRFALAGSRRFHRSLRGNLVYDHATRDLVSVQAGRPEPETERVAIKGRRSHRKHVKTRLGEIPLSAQAGFGPCHAGFADQELPSGFSVFPRACERQSDHSQARMIFSGQELSPLSATQPRAPPTTTAGRHGHEKS